MDWILCRISYLYLCNICALRTTVYYLQKSQDSNTTLDKVNNTRTDLFTVILSTCD